MRRSTNVTLTTLAVVFLVTIVAVAVALVRYEGEGQHEHGAKPGDAQTAPNHNQQDRSAIERQPTTANPDTHDPAHGPAHDR